MTAGRYTDYDYFAWLYNRYWSKRLIDQIFWTIEEHLLRGLPAGGRILDVGCGNGHLAALLTARGFRVLGIDGSEPMLEYARHNAPAAEFLVEDARDFQYDRLFDAVVSTCDSLNHIMRLEELEQTFGNIYRALVPGGRLLFDLNTEQGYRDYWTGQTSGRVEEDHAFILKLSYDDKARQSEFAVTLFRLLDGTWQRSDVRLTQQYYPPDDVTPALQRSGFMDIRSYDTERDFEIAGTGRTMYLAQRPE